MTGTPAVDLAALVRIDPDSQQPPYAQLSAAVADLVATGEILAGQRLPTVRALAADLGLAPNTVARSYREMEADGLVETRGRHGTFVRVGADHRQSAAQQATVEHVSALRAMGVDDDTIVALVTRAVGG